MRGFFDMNQINQKEATLYTYQFPFNDVLTGGGKRYSVGRFNE
jgi:hypothetical protein